MHKNTPARQLRTRLLVGLLLSTAIGLLAYQRRSLSRSGVLGAILTGTITYGLGKLPWAASLINFFVSSTLLSHFKEDEKNSRAADKFSKGGQRDIGQVAANSGVSTSLATIYALSKSPNLRVAAQAGHLGALATANADTWATEVGVLNTGSPRLITTGARVSPGTSGAISLLGTTASAAGALEQGIVYSLLSPNRSLRLPLLSLITGLAGSLFDSFLGATVQVVYFCPHCQKETERRIHTCGAPTLYLRGLPWLDNDIVNFLATLFGAMLAIFLQRPLSVPFPEHIVRQDNKKK
jgi:uncharacterized protein (TIGR00297 family)